MPQLGDLKRLRHLRLKMLDMYMVTPHTDDEDEEELHFAQLRVLELLQASLPLLTQLQTLDLLADESPDVLNVMNSKLRSVFLPPAPHPPFPTLCTTSSPSPSFSLCEIYKPIYAAIS